MLRTTLTFCAAALAALAAPLAHAQAYPSKPVRVIVTFPPGGATDTIARALSQPLTQALGQQVVVENRPGANAIIGMEACAKAAPDGYTLCLTNNDAITFNPALFAKLPYDPERDLYPIANVGVIEQVIVANAGLPAGSFKEMLELSRRNPGTVTWSSFGPGSMGHLYVDWLNNNARAKIVHVPYKGAGPAMNAVAAGEVGVSLFAVGAALPLVKAGKLKPLAIVASKRSTHMPDVPTLDELGYPFVVRAWLGVFAQKAVPDDVARRLNAEIGKILGDPAFREKWLAVQAIDAAPNSLEQFAAFIREDQKVALTNLRAAGIHLD